MSMYFFGIFHVFFTLICWVFLSLSSFKTPLHIKDISLSSVVYVANTFSQCVTCFLTLFMEILPCEVLFYVVTFINIFFNWLWITNQSENIPLCYWEIHWYFFLIPIWFILCLTFRSLIHLVLNFMYYIRYASNFIFFQMDTCLFQQHLSIY